MVRAVVLWVGTNDRGSFDHGAWSTPLDRVAGLGCPAVVVGLLLEATGGGRRKFDFNQDICDAAALRGFQFLPLSRDQKTRSVDELHLHRDDYAGVAQSAVSRLGDE